MTKKRPLGKERSKNPNMIGSYRKYGIVSFNGNCFAWACSGTSTAADAFIFVYASGSIIKFDCSDGASINTGTATGTFGSINFCCHI